MFSKEIIDNDSFLDLSTEAKLTYFLFGMFADDDGILRNAKSIMRLHGLNVSALDELVAENYVIKIEKAVVIRHWKINNLLRKDRYNPSSFPERDEILENKKTKIYYTKSEIENYLSDKNFISLDESNKKSDDDIESDPKLSAENKTENNKKDVMSDDDCLKAMDKLRQTKGINSKYD